MNRTTLLLVSAAVLCVIALAAGRSPTAPNVVAFAPQPAASGGLSLTAQLSSTRVLAGESQVYAQLDLRAGAGEGGITRVPVNLAVAIDRSGSMGGGKMAQALRAAHALVDQLLPGDRLAIVAFDTAVSVYPSQPVTAETQVSMHAFVGGIREAGSTNISAALEASYEQLRPHASEYRVSRVVLLSDGVPTAGTVDAGELTRFAAKAREEKISTSSFGIGLDYNAALMRDLAAQGGGGYSFVEDAANLGPAFARELSDASQLLARDVRVRLETPDGVTVGDVPGHDFDRVLGGRVEVPLYDFGPGQTAQLLVRLKVHAPSDGIISLGTASVSFVDVQHDRMATIAQRLEATVTTDASQVTAATNAGVMEMARAVDITHRVQEAQQAYERGDTTSAFDIMASVRRQFGASADALAGDENIIEGSWRRGGDDARRANLQLTKKTMQNFGQNNAY